MADLSMESLFVMGNGSALNQHVRKEQELSQPNPFVEINLVSTNKPQLREMI